MKPQPLITRDWKWSTAEGSRVTACWNRRLTFREKLEWLEEAETLTLQFQANRGDRTKREIALQEANESQLWIELLIDDCALDNEASQLLLTNQMS
jgi:hypothetical protein